MPESQDINGRAALAICESLLLALNDRNVMPEPAILGVLKDAALTLENPLIGVGNAALRLAAATLIHNIILGRNSVRRP